MSTDSEGARRGPVFGELMSLQLPCPSASGGFGAVFPRLARVRLAMAAHAVIEVRCGDHMIILDAGTGIRLLGNELVRANSAVDAEIFFSHCHIDHINGLPFFAPAFTPGNRLRLWAGNLMPTHRLEEVVRRIVSPPLFPVEVEIFKARMEYRDFRAGDVLQPRSGVTVRTAPLDHPDGATGYRIEYGGRSVAYITDTETRHDDCIRRIMSLARAVDLMTSIPPTPRKKYRRGLARVIPRAARPSAGRGCRSEGLLSVPP